MTYNKKHLGFTLVELSIVIIIIGFLIAGISGGKSLIEQAKLNSVISELQKYQLIYNNFQLPIKVYQVICRMLQPFSQAVILVIH